MFRNALELHHFMGAFWGVDGAPGANAPPCRFWASRPPGPPSFLLMESARDAVASRRQMVELGRPNVFRKAHEPLRPMGAFSGIDRGGVREISPRFLFPGARGKSAGWKAGMMPYRGPRGSNRDVRTCFGKPASRSVRWGHFWDSIGAASGRDLPDFFFPGRGAGEGAGNE